MENQRIRDFYHASLSEAFAYAELDLEKGQLRQQVVSGQSAHQGLKEGESVLTVSGRMPTPVFAGT